MRSGAELDDLIKTHRRTLNYSHVLMCYLYGKTSGVGLEIRVVAKGVLLNRLAQIWNKRLLLTVCSSCKMPALTPSTMKTCLPLVSP